MPGPVSVTADAAGERVLAHLHAARCRRRACAPCSSSATFSSASADQAASPCERRASSEASMRAGDVAQVQWRRPVATQRVARHVGRRPRRAALHAECPGVHLRHLEQRWKPASPHGSIMRLQLAQRARCASASSALFSMAGTMRLMAVERGAYLVRHVGQRSRPARSSRASSRIGGVRAGRATIFDSSFASTARSPSR